MKAIRLIVTQNKAHYKKEETITNKMTYPLPPFSTIIGAIHNACNYKEYHPMDLSIQGSYESMGKEAYTDYCFLNSVYDDRGLLVKSTNEDFHSNAFVKIGKALKSTDNSFRKNIQVQIYNQTLIEEYRSLKDKLDELEIFKIKLKFGKDISNQYSRLISTKNSLSFSKEDKKINNKIKDEIKKLLKKSPKGIESLIKVRKKSLKEKKKNFEKKSKDFNNLTDRENQIKTLEKKIKEKLTSYTYKNYTKEISKYQSLTTSLKYYEVLYGVKLVIHIKSDEETLNDIKKNIYNLRAIGRSEDFVEVEECEIVELTNEVDEEHFDFWTDNLVNTPNHLGYLNFSHVQSNQINILNSEGISKNGTKYYLNKDYIIEDNKRIFNKKKVIFTSKYNITSNSKDIFIDKINEKNYIVSFI